MKNLLAAALLPALLLMLYIRKKDKIEQEPLGMVALLVVFGALTTISAMILETIGENVVLLLFVPNSTVYNLILYFIVVAGSEELGKFVVLKWRTWKSPEFNYTYDAIVYAVAVSLGFAALENVLYVFSGGLYVAILRALTAVPGHAMFSVFMGYYYGLAKKASVRGDAAGEKLNLVKAYVVPVLIHGFYDFCLTVGSWLFVIIFFAFYIGAVIFAAKRVNKLSREDAPVADGIASPQYTDIK